jgi:hypothetical protein
MENYDQRPRHAHEDPSRGDPSRPGYENDDRDRERRPFADDRYGQQRESRDRDQERYGQGGGTERSRFSPDWSQDDAEPRYSSDRYYSRNRDYQESRPEERSRGGRQARWRGDQNRTTTPEQRDRGFEPRSERGDWPGDSGRGLYGSDYPRDEQGRDFERGRDDEQESHYRGYYNRSVTPYSYPGGRGNLFVESWAITGPHTGRGPKGYKRSDQQIVEDASQRLERDGHVDATEIEVTAEDGVIRLRGTVADRASKRRAEECVESVYGARDVMNELRVSAPDAEAHGGGAAQSSPSSAASADDKKPQRGSTNKPQH